MKKEEEKHKKEEEEAAAGKQGKGGLSFGGGKPRFAKGNKVGNKGEFPELGQDFNPEIKQAEERRQHEGGAKRQEKEEEKEAPK